MQNYYYFKTCKKHFSLADTGNPKAIISCQNSALLYTKIKPKFSKLFNIHFKNT